MSYWLNKVAIVTGGSSGLGRALVEALLRADGKVVAVARGAQRLEELRGLPAGPDAELVTVTADVTQEPDVQRVVQQTVDRFGHIDALVNCAGISTRAAILETTPADLQAMWEVNLLAAVRTMRASAPYLLKSKGHVINIGSLASKTAGPFLGGYPSTKHALAAYTQQLRLELGPQGLHVLLVCPGPIARDDTLLRYGHIDVPAEMRAPGGGAKVRPLHPQVLAEEILRACEKRKTELVRPRKARILFAAASVSPRLGDWLLRRFVPPGDS